ncbi:MAG: hypothetical protein J6V40_01470 [Clostridia bacterium]|nr:hypothetical protein [Clostridia bacterium]
MKRNDYTQDLFIKCGDGAVGKALYTFYHDGFFVATSDKNLYGMLVRDSVARTQKQGKKSTFGSIEEAGFAFIPELSLSHLMQHTAWTQRSKDEGGKGSIKRLVTNDLSSYTAEVPSKFTNALFFSSGEAMVDGRAVEGDVTVILSGDDNRKRMLGFIDSVASNHMEKYGANKYTCMKGVAPLNIEASFANQKVALPYNGVYDNRTKIGMAKRMVYQGMLRAEELEREDITPSMGMEKEYIK